MLVATKPPPPSFASLPSFARIVPHIAAAFPLGIDLEAGKTYYWCTCGLSKNQPFCDGSVCVRECVPVNVDLSALTPTHSAHSTRQQHKGTTFSPLAFTASASEKKYICQCKATKNPPFCDVSSLFFYPATQRCWVTTIITATDPHTHNTCMHTSHSQGTHKSEDFVKRYNQQLLKANGDLRTEVEALRAELAKLKGPKTDAV